MLPSSVLLLLATVIQAPWVSASLVTEPSWKTVPRQLLQASTKLAKLQERDNSFTLTYSAILHYGADVGSVSDDFATVMDVHIQSERPFLMLEDNEDLLRSVTCQASLMRMEFANDQAFEESKDGLYKLQKSLVVTSHSQCNEDGARSVYRIADVLLSEATSTAILQIRPLSWNEAFPGYRLSLDSQQQAAHYMSRRSILQRRQFDVLPANISSIPAPVPSANNATTSTSSTADLTHSLIDYELSSHGLVGQSIPLTLNCKNCSTLGSMKLTRGAFEFANSTQIFDEVTDDTNDSVQLLKSGSLELQVDNFSAHIELESELVTGFTQGFKLYSLPIVGYEVPHFGIIGVFLNVTLSVGFEIKGGLSFGYGFEVALPSTSNITVNFANINSSSSHGFGDATLTTLPLTANVSAVDLAVTAAVHPQVMVGFAINEEALGQNLAATMEAGVFLNLPKLSAAFGVSSPLSNYTCFPGESSVPNDYLAQLGDLTHVVPTAEVDLGVQANLAVAAGTHAKALAFPTVLLSATMGLPTSCLAYDPTASTFVDAQTMIVSVSSFFVSLSSASASSASAAQASTTAAHKGAAGMVHPPLKGLFTAKDGALMAGSTFALIMAALAFTIL